MNGSTLCERIAQTIGISAPLVVIESVNGLCTLKDPDADGGRGEIYGNFIADSDGSVKLQVYPYINSEVSSFMLLEDVWEIKETSKYGEIEITKADGNVVQVGKMIRMPDGFDVVPECSYRHPSLRAQRYCLYKCYPDIESHFYWNDLELTSFVNMKMVDGGEDNWIPYQGVKSPVITDIKLRLETECRTVTKAGVMYDEYLAPITKDIDSLLKSIIRRRHLNPFVETLRRIKWDGVARIDTFLRSIGGYARGVPEDKVDEYLAIVMRAFLTSVLERNLNASYHPIQFILVLMGPQNTKKSAFCSKLGLNQYTLQTTQSPKDTKKFVEDSLGAIIMELVEGAGVANLSAADSKAFIDLTSPKFRWAYAEMPEKYQIRFTSVITTNDDVCLKDATGNRRYFPVQIDPHQVKKWVTEYDDEEIWQLWAEAYHYYVDGERWNTYIYEPSGPLRHMFLMAQDAVSEPEKGGALLREYLDSVKPNIGDHVTKFDLQEYFDAHQIFYGDAETYMSNFNHHASGYGWKKVEKPYHFNHPLKGVRTTTTDAWVRVEPPKEHHEEVMF